MLLAWRKPGLHFQTNFMQKWSVEMASLIKPTKAYCRHMIIFVLLIQVSDAHCTPKCDFGAKESGAICLLTDSDETTFHMCLSLKNKFYCSNSSGVEKYDNSCIFDAYSSGIKQDNLALPWVSTDVHAGFQILLQCSKSGKTTGSSFILCCFFYFHWYRPRPVRSFLLW